MPIITLEIRRQTLNLIQTHQSPRQTCLLTWLNHQSSRRLACHLPRLLPSPCPSSFLCLCLLRRSASSASPWRRPAALALPPPSQGPSPAPGFLELQLHP